MQTQLSVLRNKTIAAIVKSYRKGKLIEEIDSLPHELAGGEDWKPSSRLVKSREQEEQIYRNKILSILGFVGDECKSDIPLHEYAEQALKRTSLHEPVFGIAQDCCNHCHFSGYFISQGCEGCASRPCATNCPKQCISFNEDGKAVIDQEKCIKCGKCFKNCSYGIILKKSIPCVRACPCNAMKDSPEGIKSIDFDRCINCGGCLRACPFGAIVPRSNIIDVLKAMKTKRVYACPAPSISAHFGKYDVETVSGGLIALGFAGVEDVSYGADICALNEAKEFEERIIIQKKPFMTTSCCPAYVNCIHKHMKDLEDYVSHTPTPMHFTTELVKQKDPDAITVFIGPCNAKRWETLQDTTTDYCLTFDEIHGLFEGFEIDLSTVSKYNFHDKAHKEGKVFAISGGVASAVASLLPQTVSSDDIHPVLINGFTPENYKKLQNFKRNPTGNIVEVMVCEGGCAHGPGCPELNTPLHSAKIKLAVDKMPPHPLGRWTDVPNSKIPPIQPPK